MADYATATYPAGDQAERAFERIIGNSAALESVFRHVEQVAPTDSTVLIEGETGTGKELIAHADISDPQREGSEIHRLPRNSPQIPHSGFVVIGDFGDRACRNVLTTRIGHLQVCGPGST